MRLDPVEKEEEQEEAMDMVDENGFLPPSPSFSAASGGRSVSVAPVLVPVVETSRIKEKNKAVSVGVFCLSGVWLMGM